MSAPPSPARNDDSANAPSLMVGTAMPIEAAARSLERTASILRPLPARMMLLDEDEGERHDDEHEDAERQPGDVAALPDRQVDAEQLGVRDQVRGARHHARVAEHEALDGDGRRQRDDRQLGAADAQGGEPDDDADRGGDARGQQERQRERDAGADLRQHQPGDAGEGGLDERDLPDHARQEHERQGDQRDRQAGDDAEAVAAAGDREHDEPGGDEDGDDDGRLRGRITGGIRERMSSPRSGIDRPETNSVTTMTTNGTASVRPSFAHSGHQSFVLDRKSSSDWSTPSASPPMSPDQIELSRAISATASAGTTSSVRLPGVRTPTAGRR